MNWLSLFSKMVNELQQHSQVQVLTYRTFPPIEQKQIEQLEEKYNIQLPSVIRDFYIETNGLQLRWFLKNNEHFSLEKYQEENENLDWDYFKKSFRWEDGGIMILPLEQALEEKVFDAFSESYNMVFTFENFHLSVSEDEHFSNDFFTTDFESYLEFLLAGRGLISRRSFFYEIPKDFIFGRKSIHILTPNSFWTKRKTLNINQAILKDKFPHCDQVRFSENKLNATSLKLIAQNGVKISQDDLEKMVEEHHQFLMSGGVGGEWKVLEIRGIVTAFYNHKKEITEGEQANLERKNLTDISFEKIEIPYSNFCWIFAERVDFSKSNLERSVFTDAFLEGANFYNSTLTGLDFSRSDLRNVNFENANLEDVDFENCDLRGANFEGAKMEGASFVNALLTDD